MRATTREAAEILQPETITSRGVKRLALRIPRDLRVSRIAVARVEEDRDQARVSTSASASWHDPLVDRPPHRIRHRAGNIVGS